ncbi:MAG: hypothetical protein OSB07_13000 [Dehalococcoidia bacterium]|nr:hypothetical protein [Dehalococcoidia bacterium]
MVYDFPGAGGGDVYARVLDPSSSDCLLLTAQKLTPAALRENSKTVASTYGLVLVTVNV